MKVREIQTEQNSLTILTGELLDQAALVGFINYLYGIGLPLIQVELINQE